MKSLRARLVVFSLIGGLLADPATVSAFAAVPSVRTSTPLMTTRINEQALAGILLSAQQPHNMLITIPYLAVLLGTFLGGHHAGSYALLGLSPPLLERIRPVTAAILRWAGIRAVIGAAGTSPDWVKVRLVPLPFRKWGFRQLSLALRERPSALLHDSLVSALARDPKLREWALRDDKLSDYERDLHTQLYEGQLRFQNLEDRFKEVEEHQLGKREKYIRRIWFDPKNQSWILETLLPRSHFRPLMRRVAWVRVRYDRDWSNLEIPAYYTDLDFQRHHLFSNAVRVLTKDVSTVLSVVVELTTLTALYDGLQERLRLPDAPPAAAAMRDYLRDTDAPPTVAAWKAKLDAQGVAETDLANYLTTALRETLWNVLQRSKGWAWYTSVMPKTLIGKPLHDSGITTFELVADHRSKDIQLHTRRPGTLWRESALVSPRSEAFLGKRPLDPELDETTRQWTASFIGRFENRFGIPVPDELLTELHKNLRQGVLDFGSAEFFLDGLGPSIGRTDRIDRRSDFVDAFKHFLDTFDYIEELQRGTLSPDLAGLSVLEDARLPPVQAHWAASLVRYHGFSQEEVLRWLKEVDAIHNSFEERRRDAAGVPNGDAVPGPGPKKKKLPGPQRNSKAMTLEALRWQYLQQLWTAIAGQIERHTVEQRRHPEVALRLLGAAYRNENSRLHGEIDSIMSRPDVSWENVLHHTRPHRIKGYRTVYDYNTGWSRSSPQVSRQPVGRLTPEERWLLTQAVMAVARAQRLHRLTQEAHQVALETQHLITEIRGVQQRAGKFLQSWDLWKNLRRPAHQLDELLSKKDAPYLSAARRLNAKNFISYLVELLRLAQRRHHVLEQEATQKQIETALIYLESIVSELSRLDLETIAALDALNREVQMQDADRSAGSGGATTRNSNDSRGSRTILGLALIAGLAGGLGWWLGHPGNYFLASGIDDVEILTAGYGLTGLLGHFWKLPVGADGEIRRLKISPTGTRQFEIKRRPLAFKDRWLGGAPERINLALKPFDISVALDMNGVELISFPVDARDVNRLIDTFLQSPARREGIWKDWGLAIRFYNAGGHVERKEWLRRFADRGELPLAMHDRLAHVAGDLRMPADLVEETRWHLRVAFALEDLAGGRPNRNLKQGLFKAFKDYTGTPTYVLENLSASLAYALGDDPFYDFSHGALWRTQAHLISENFNDLDLTWLDSQSFPQKYGLTPEAVMNAFVKAGPRPAKFSAPTPAAGGTGKQLIAFALMAGALAGIRWLAGSTVPSVMPTLDAALISLPADFLSVDGVLKTVELLLLGGLLTSSLSALWIAAKGSLLSPGLPESNGPALRLYGEVSERDTALKELLTLQDVRRAFTDDEHRLAKSVEKVIMAHNISPDSAIHLHAMETPGYWVKKLKLDPQRAALAGKVYNTCRMSIDDEPENLTESDPAVIFQKVIGVLKRDEWVGFNVSRVISEYEGFINRVEANGETVNLEESAHSLLSWLVEGDLRATMEQKSLLEELHVNVIYGKDFREMEARGEAGELDVFVRAARKKILEARLREVENGRGVRLDKARLRANLWRLQRNTGIRFNSGPTDRPIPRTTFLNILEKYPEESEWIVLKEGHALRIVQIEPPEAVSNPAAGGHVPTGRPGDRRDLNTILSHARGHGWEGVHWDTRVASREQPLFGPRINRVRYAPDGQPPLERPGAPADGLLHIVNLPMSLTDGLNRMILSIGNRKFAVRKSDWTRLWQVDLNALNSGDFPALFEETLPGEFDQVDFRDRPLARSILNAFVIVDGLNRYHQVSSPQTTVSFHPKGFTIYDPQIAEVENNYGNPVSADLKQLYLSGSEGGVAEVIYAWNNLFLWLAIEMSPVLRDAYWQFYTRRAKKTVLDHKFLTQIPKILIKLRRPAGGLTLSGLLMVLTASLLSGAWNGGTLAPGKKFSLLRSAA